MLGSALPTIRGIFYHISSEPLSILPSLLLFLFPEEAQENQATALTDDQISEMVDNIIQEDDRNKDGYIDYHEFMMSQQR